MTDDIAALIHEAKYRAEDKDHNADLLLRLADALSRPPLPEIAALILELYAWVDENCCGPDWAAGKTVHQRAVAMLERLSVPPLTEEIAGLIEQLHTRGESRSGVWKEQTLEWKAAAALRALAQENERLKAADWSDVGAVSILKKRIRELETERDQMIRVAKIWQERYEEAIGGQVAIRARTIEECAKIADSFRCGLCGMDGKSGDAIRALAHASTSAQQDESKTESDIRAKTIEECADHMDARGYLIAGTALRALAQTDEG